MGKTKPMEFGAPSPADEEQAAGTFIPTSENPDSPLVDAEFPDEPESGTLADLAKAEAEFRSSEIKEIKETLKCHLTLNEVREYGILLAQTTAEISQAEDELQAVKSQYKSRIDKSIASRNEYSWETVRVRVMTADERQRGLEL